MEGRDLSRTIVNSSTRPSQRKLAINCATLKLQTPYGCTRYSKPVKPYSATALTFIYLPLLHHRVRLRVLVAPTESCVSCPIYLGTYIHACRCSVHPAQRATRHTARRQSQPTRALRKISVVSKSGHSPPCGVCLPALAGAVGWFVL